ncbi:hypothetical protein K5X82_15750 [Halosquirtibacter xylanolyticus]|uniref:hypothetical protein n=1 Tax=Halosquirtibacter xylanolyticus TaxID=3374599 RepID=UPI003748BFF2|nr:hypothetical protein K5X82_15750 [Prolixibacteraceae bacterium]
MPNLISLEHIDNDYQEQFSINDVDSKIYKLQKMKARRYEHVIIAEDYSYIYLQDKIQEDITSQILLSPKIIADKQYYEIYWTSSKSKKKGDLSYLFEILIKELNLQIISDKEQTFPGAKNFWTSLSKKQFVAIYRLVMPTNHRRRYENCKEYHIWGIKGFEDIGNEFNSSYESRLTLDGSYIEPEEYVISGLEDIDTVIQKNKNSPIDYKGDMDQSIEEYCKKYGKRIRDCESIRLLARAK